MLRKAENALILKCWVQGGQVRGLGGTRGISFSVMHDRTLRSWIYVITYINILPLLELFFFRTQQWWQYYMGVKRIKGISLWLWHTFPMTWRNLHLQELWGMTFNTAACLISPLFQIKNTLFSKQVTYWLTGLPFAMPREITGNPIRRTSQ